MGDSTEGRSTHDAHDLSTALPEAPLCKLEVLFVAELLDQQGGSAKVVARDAREQVVGDLLVEPAVDELDRRITDHLQSGHRAIRVSENTFEKGEVK